MKRLITILAASLFILVTAHGQVPTPQIMLTGNIGAGFVGPLFNSGNLVYASDANRTMAYPETSAFIIKVTSTVSLTATRNLIAPVGYFPFVIENLTTGGQSIQFIGTSGTGITIPNGSAAFIAGDGTNYFSLTGSGGGSGVASINGTTGAFTFTGSGVSCTSTTCTFSSGSGMVYPSGSGVAVVSGGTSWGTTLPVAGSGSGVTTGPNSGVTPGDIALFTGTGGQITDGVIAGSNLALLSGTQTFTGNKTFSGTVTLPAGQVVNGVTLTTGGSSTTFLNGAGSYSTPAGGGSLSGMTAGQVPIAATSSTVTSSVAASIIINTITCPLGAAGCTVTLPPPVNYVNYPAAVSDGGSAAAGACTRYATNQPQTGSVNSAASSLGYLAFQAAPTSSQYCEFTRIEPPYWTGTSIALNFMTSVTTGNVIWDVQTVCVPVGTALTTSYSPTFSTATGVTTTVNSTAYGATQTTTLSAIAAPGSGNCPSSPTTPTLVTYRVFRSASDTAAANANLLFVIIGSGRSQ